ncbi:MAG: hypothetical protein MUC77_10590 [Chromatiaceae bacterium]|jgi:hypothetical protein|nr:hypothetical protein [Chromatiaceae bacterium]
MGYPQAPSSASTQGSSQTERLVLRALLLSGLVWSVLGLAVLATLAQVLVSIWGPIA